MVLIKNLQFMMNIKKLFRIINCNNFEVMMKEIFKIWLSTMRKMMINKCKLIQLKLGNY